MTSYLRCHTISYIERYNKQARLGKLNVTKPHPNISIRTNINIDLSADQWGLDTDRFPRTIIERVASFMNKRITGTFNQGYKRPVVEQQFQVLAEHFKLYGATGTTTQEVLKELLDELFIRQDSVKTFND